MLLIYDVWVRSLAGLSWPILYQCILCIALSWNFFMIWGFRGMVWICMFVSTPGFFHVWSLEIKLLRKLFSQDGRARMSGAHWPDLTIFETSSIIIDRIAYSFTNQNNISYVRALYTRGMPLNLQADADLRHARWWSVKVELYSQVLERTKRGGISLTERIRNF